MSVADSNTEIAVLGAGNWGTTLAHSIARNGHPVTLWVRSQAVCTEINEKRTNEKYLPGFELSENIHAVNDITAAVDGVPIVLMVIPSKAFRAVCRQLAPVLRPDQSIVHATKGIEFGSYKRMSEILIEETCVRRIAVLSGPNIALEIMEGKPTGTVIASRFPRLIQDMERLLVSELFRVYVNDDVVGAEMGGALKNIIAIAGGVAAELELGENAKSLLITRGLGEIMRLGIVFGARPETFSGLAGLGDLIVTCASRHSRNHRLGRALASGMSLEEARASLGMVAEGAYTAEVANAYAEEHGLYTPVFQNVYRMVHEGLPAAEALRNLMAMDSRPDVDIKIRRS